MSNAFSTSKDQAAAQASPKTGLKTDPGVRASKPKRSAAVIGGIGCAITVVAVVAAVMATRNAPAPVDAVPAPAVQSSVATIQQSTVANIQSPAAVSSSAVAPDRPAQCEMPSLALRFWGKGSVRIRSGSYVSPPIQLSQEFQQVSFPIPGPSQAGDGSITVESATGIATLVYFEKIENEPAGTVLTNASREQHFSSVGGSFAHSLPISIGWNPRKPC